MGRPPKAKMENDLSTLYCMCCGKSFTKSDFYKSNSELYSQYKMIPWCKDCIDNIYYGYLNKYEANGYAEPEKKAVERICMFLDVYFCDKVYNTSIKLIEDGKSTSTLILTYLKTSMLVQYKIKSYDNTLQERYNDAKYIDRPVSIYTDEDSNMTKSVEAATKLFGGGFENDDYVYLYNQYSDWTARHECNTKAQEEVFKNICLTQLQLVKATRAREDTKDLSLQLQRWLDTGKLQPKQNSGDTTADNQTFGTLIDKWENTRPIPEPEGDLKDVDKIGLYIDVFFRGHLAKMMGLKNGLSKLYERYMEKYTVEKPEYDDDEDNEALFDAIFGDTINDDD